MLHVNFAQNSLHSYLDECQKNEIHLLYLNNLNYFCTIFSDFECNLKKDIYNYLLLIELQHDKTNKMTCAPSEPAHQPGHQPSLMRVFAVRLKKLWLLCLPTECTAKID